MAGYKTSYSVGDITQYMYTDDVVLLKLVQNVVFARP